MGEVKKLAASATHLSPVGRGREPGVKPGERVRG